MDEPCLIDNCNRSPYSRGWCEKHYRRWLRTGDPTAWDQRPTVCTVGGCENDVDARGLCHGHYQRWQRHGDVLADHPLTRRKQPAVCTAQGCGRRTNANGLCRAHRARELEYGDPFPDVPLASSSRPRDCAVRGCLQQPIARSLCGDHYVQLLKGGAAAGRSLTGAPQGGGWLSHGYVGVPVPEPLRHLVAGSQETEHRLVMVAQLGRPLAPDETVHHVNGNRLDNRSENLELWSTMHPKGQRVEDKVTFALEMLRRYHPETLSPEARGR